jgi:hypothetical protein
MTKSPSSDPEAARQARLASALRENLQKRKARDRATAMPEQTAITGENAGPEKP